MTTEALQEIYSPAGDAFTQVIAVCDENEAIGEALTWPSKATAAALKLLPPDADREHIRQAELAARGDSTALGFFNVLLRERLETVMRRVGVPAIIGVCERASAFLDAQAEQAAVLEIELAEKFGVVARHAISDQLANHAARYKAEAGTIFYHFGSTDPRVTIRETGWSADGNYALPGIHAHARVAYPVVPHIGAKPVMVVPDEVLASPRK